MKKNRHTPEQIIRKLRDVEADLAAGLSVGEIARKLGITEATRITAGRRNTATSTLFPANRFLWRN